MQLYMHMFHVYCYYFKHIFNKNLIFILNASKYIKWVVCGECLCVSVCNSGCEKLLIFLLKNALLSMLVLLTAIVYFDISFILVWFGLCARGQCALYTNINVPNLPHKISIRLHLCTICIFMYVYVWHIRLY